MATQRRTVLETNHPAPHRDRVGSFALAFALFGAALAWLAQIFIGPALGGHFCYPSSTPLAAPAIDGLWTMMLVMDLIAIVIAAVAGGIALRDWRRTYDEQAGSQGHLLDAGEGRTRFLTMWGIMTSLAFIVGLIFSITMLFLVPICNG